MAIPATAKYRATRSYRDHATRNSSISFAISAADWAAYGTDTSAGPVSDVFSAVDALSLDTPTLGRASKNFDQPGLTPTTPSDENAVNSAKLLVLIADTAGNKFSMQIPARDATHFTSARGLVNIGIGVATTQISDLLAAVAGGVLSEDGLAVTVYEIRVMGKGTAA